MTYVLKGGTLVDGTGAAPLHRSVVVMDGGLISKVGTEVEFGANLGQLGEVIDVSGRTVLPGLINTHEHLDNRGGTGTFHSRAAQDTHELTLRSFRACLWDLRDGVTTVREMGGKGATGLIVKKAVETGMIVGPRIYTCGSAIAMTGGHGDDVCYVADGVDECLTAARVLIRKGADFIKVMASGGNLNVGRDYPWSPQLTVAEMKAAFNEAKKIGRPTASHAHPPKGIKWSIEAGADCIEHGGLLDQPTAELMAKKGIYLVPTLGQSYVTGQRGAALGRPQWLEDRSREGWAGRLERFGYAVKAGVKIGAGTDVIADLFDELEMLVWGGLSNMQAIEAATRVNAEILRESDRLGTVAAGKLADVIVVDGDPLADIQAMRKVSLVFKEGRLFHSADLAASTNPGFC